ncbi:MAG TPA: PQQ-binding-like beta-propeller repeat protein [bacterium]|nr:PQQ-binding-like beta-propeller repeat protein [bacterium]
MKSWTMTGLLLVLLCLPAAAQIQILLDNDTPACTLVGTWNEKISSDAVNGQARYKVRTTTGANYALWQVPIKWPGSYVLEANLIKGNYADSVFYTIHTAAGDTTVVISQNYLQGRQKLGEFSLAGQCWIKMTDKAAGKGNMVFADAIILTANIATWPLSGQVRFSDNNPLITGRLTLSPAGGGATLIEKILTPDAREFLFPGVVDGWYRLSCSAYGYETALLDSIHVQGQAVTAVELVMVPAAGARSTISGTVRFQDGDPLRSGRLELFAQGDPLLVASAQLLHDTPWSISGLLPGRYRLLFTAPNCLTDSTTYAEVLLGESDLQLEPLILYPFFRFAWLTDSHVGSGNDDALQIVLRRIALMKEGIDFVIHTGDISEKGLESEFTLYKSYESLCQLPVYNIPGNHETKWSPSGLQAWTRKFGERHFTFTHKGFKFIGLNNGIPMRGGCGYIDPADIAWLKEELAGIDAATPVVFAIHLPLDVTNTPNYWEAVDLLKAHRTVWIMVGHGHVNKSYNFEGIPGAMGRDTYSGDAGFNIVTLSEKEIRAQVCTAVDGVVAPAWYQTSTLQTVQPAISFTNLAKGSTLAGGTMIDISVSESVRNGQWDLSNSSLGLRALAGGGTAWQCELPATGIENGYHTLRVSFTTEGGKTIAATTSFFFENGHPKALWKYDCGAEVLTQPAFDEAGVYVGTSDGRIIGLSRSTGLALWPPVQCEGGVFSAPLLLDRMLYAGSADGALHAIDARTGGQKWHFQVEDAVLSAPVAQDTLIFFAGGGAFYAVGRTAGQLVWKFDGCGTVECKPCLAGNRIIFGSWDGKVRALDTATGQQLWIWTRQANFYYAPAACWPVASADKLFVTDPERYTSALDLATGRTVWSSKSPEVYDSIGISGDGSRLYVRSLDGSLYAFSTADAAQQKLWQSDVGYGWDSTPSMPIEKEGVVYSAGKKCFVAANDGATGATWWKYWIGPTHATTVTPIDRSHVLASSLDGVVLFIEGDPATRIREESSDALPQTSRLFPPYPNPFNSSVSITYTLSSRQPVAVTIYNVRGEEVYSSPARDQAAGEHHFTWQGVDRSGRAVPSGIYYLRLQGSDLVQTVKLALVK